MHANGSLQRLPDWLRCRVRDQLETDVYSAIHTLVMHSSRVADIAGTGKPDEFIEATRLCEKQRMLIHELEKQIAAHRKEHGC
jgi:hypothetical protein